MGGTTMSAERRMRRTILAAVGAVAVGTAPYVLAADAFTLGDYSGEELFGRFCASCHGEHARGDGPVARSLNTAVPDLTRIRARYGEFPAMLVRDTIDGRGVDIRAHGTRAMPVWGYEFWVDEGGDVVAQKVVRAAINRLVDYLRSLQREADDSVRQPRN